MYKNPIHILQTSYDIIISYALILNRMQFANDVLLLPGIRRV